MGYINCFVNFVNKKLGIWPFWAKNPGKCVGKIKTKTTPN